MKQKICVKGGQWVQFEDLGEMPGDMARQDRGEMQRASRRRRGYDSPTRVASSVHPLHQIARAAGDEVLEIVHQLVG